MSNGVVVYEGPSLIDGAPLVVVVTGIQRSSNRKIGDMLQAWILRADVDPQRAVETGADVSICGDCPHRGAVTGKRSCYVLPFQAPLNIWRAYKRGVYPVNPALGVATGRKVRLGAYGDPCAVPLWVWSDLLTGSTGHTGYTHRWAWLYAGAYQGILMASVDTSAEARQARAKGWRTFRVLTGRQAPGAQEIPCVSLTHGVKCADCKLCSGAGRAKSITVRVHGTPGHNARANVEAGRA